MNTLFHNMEFSAPCFMQSLRTHSDRIVRRSGRRYFRHCCFALPLWVVALRSRRPRSATTVMSRHCLQPPVPADDKPRPLHVPPAVETGPWR